MRKSNTSTRKPTQSDAAGCSVTIISDPAVMQVHCLQARRQGRRIAFVPTMGSLHEGHLSLLRAARERGDLLVLSIFVNPTQFGRGEDFDGYPRDLTRDAEMARSAGVDLIFAPEASAMYPPGYATFVEVEGLTETLCGASRPGHFRGVTTVVAKLFGIVQPDVAFFGCKDFQQLAVIRRMSAIGRTATMACDLPAHRRGSSVEVFGYLTHRRAASNPSGDVFSLSKREG